MPLKPVIGGFVDVPVASSGSSASLVFKARYGDDPLNNNDGVGTHVETLTNAIAIIPYNKIDLDTYNAWNPSTGEYIVPSNGLYLVSAAITVINTPPDTFVVYNVTKNGGFAEAIVNSFYDPIAMGGGQTGGYGGVQANIVTKFLGCEQGDAISASVYTGLGGVWVLGSHYTTGSDDGCSIKIIKL